MNEPSSRHDGFEESLAIGKYREKILKTEYCEKFDKIRKDMMIMSYYKYGPLKDNYGTYKCMNAIENLKITADNLKFMGSNGKTLSINLPHDNISMIKFNLTNEEKDSLDAGMGTYTMTVIGYF